MWVDLAKDIMKSLEVFSKSIDSSYYRTRVRFELGKNAHLKAINSSILKIFTFSKMYVMKCRKFFNNKSGRKLEFRLEKIKLLVGCNWSLNSWRSWGYSWGLPISTYYCSPIWPSSWGDTPEGDKYTISTLWSQRLEKFYPSLYLGESKTFLPCLVKRLWFEMFTESAKYIQL